MYLIRACRQQTISADSLVNWLFWSLSQTDSRSARALQVGIDFSLEATDEGQAAIIGD